MSLLAIENTSFLKTLDAHVIQTVSAFSPLELSTLIWSFKRLNYKGAEEVLRVSAEAVEPRLEVLSESVESLASLAWAVASFIELFHGRRKGASPAFLQRLMSRVEAVATSILAVSTDHVTIVYALVKAQHKPDALIGKLVHAAETALSTFRPQQLSECAWVLAKLKLVKKDLLKQIAEAAEPMLGRFSGLELGELAWAFAELGYETERLLPKIVTMLVVETALIPTRTMVCLLQALSQVKSLLYAPSFSDVLSSMKHHCQYCGLEELAITLEVMQRAKDRPVEVLKPLMAAASKQLESATGDDRRPHDASRLLVSFAHLQCGSKELVESAMKYLEDDAIEMEPLIELLWAFIHLKHYVPKTIYMDVDGESMITEACLLES